MAQLALHILRFFFEALVIFVLNYVMLAGIRDILYFLLPIGPPSRKKAAAVSWSNFLKPGFAYRILFWAAFVIAILRLNLLFFHFLIFVLISYFLFSVAERRRLGPGLLIFLTSILLAAITAILISSQPVLMNIENQMSADLWVYNASNSMIDTMLQAGMAMGIDTTGIERLAAIVPAVQKNIAGILYISIYLLSFVAIGTLVKVILPWTKLRMPHYYDIPPVKWFPVAAAACLVAAAYMQAPALVFVVLALYYIWGMNLAIYLLGGAHWIVFLVAVAAGAMHEPVIPVFIAAGILDNLFDIRRALRMLGVRDTPEISAT